MYLYLFLYFHLYLCPNSRSLVWWVRVNSWLAIKIFPLSAATIQPFQPMAAPWFQYAPHNAHCTVHNTHCNASSHCTLQCTLVLQCTKAQCTIQSKTPQCTVHDDYFSERILSLVCNKCSLLQWLVPCGINDLSRDLTRGLGEWEWSWKATFLIGDRLERQSLLKVNFNYFVWHHPLCTCPMLTVATLLVLFY